jgi:hypothetical protein
MARNGGTAAVRRICARFDMCDELKTPATLLPLSIDSRGTVKPLVKTLTERFKTWPFSGYLYESANLLLGVPVVIA